MIKLKGLCQEDITKLLPPNLVLLCYRGSIAHGTYVPQSSPDSIDDKDLLGVFMGSRRHYLGFGEGETWERMVDPWDVVCYEWRKMISLLLKSNPNVLSALWVDESKVLYCDDTGRMLRENRHLFASKQAYHSFSGYAHSQFKRMKHTEFHGRMGAKRKQLVERYGYDCKNAAHLIRLLKMGIEFLSEGELHVLRDDAPMLISIKRGEWPLEKVEEEAERLFTLAEEAYIRSPLPMKPDRDAAEQLCIDAIYISVTRGIQR